MLASGSGDASHLDNDFHKIQPVVEKKNRKTGVRNIEINWLEPPNPPIRTTPGSLDKFSDPFYCWLYRYLPRGDVC